MRKLPKFGCKNTHVGTTGLRCAQPLPRKHTDTRPGLSGGSSGDPGEGRTPTWVLVTAGHQPTVPTTVTGSEKQQLEMTLDQDAPGSSPAGEQNGTTHHGVFPKPVHESSRI